MRPVLGPSLTSGLPSLALSVRQPWAWAIIHAGKDVENRTAGAIRAGGMVPARICIHAAAGLTQREYRWGAWRLKRHGVLAPRPDALARGAIIGLVTVVEVVDASPSEWFGGPCGLVLRDPVPMDPVPAPGELGYFRWRPGGTLAPTRPWMTTWDRPSGDDLTAPLFGPLEPSYAEPPPKPWPKSQR